MQGMEYQTIVPKLYSVGFGVLPYKFANEYLAENLTILKKDVGIINISEDFYNYKNNDLYPREDLYPCADLYPRTPTANLLMYKFKMYKIIYSDPSSEEYELQDTGMYYTQYRELKNNEYGKLNLSIKYERG